LDPLDLDLMECDVTKTTLLGMMAGSLLALTAVPAWADLELPAPSPAAKVMQRVGLTDVSLEYSSPAAKGRKIWGDVVPFDKPWRAGANAATKITFSRDVTFGDKAVPAGTYAVVMFPGQKEWTVVLSKDMTPVASPAQYDAKNDVVKVTAKTAAIVHRERMIFVFDATTDTDTSLDLEWDKLRVSVPIHADTVAQAKKNVEKELGGAWRPFANAARYEAETLKDLAAAGKHIDQSIAIESTWYNHWIKSTVRTAEGKKADACTEAKVAWELGQKDANFFYKDVVDKAVKACK
jgi:hypothetical protein